MVDIRQATNDDLDEVRRVVEAAYTPWIEVVGIRPLPMDADYGSLVAAGKTWVVEHEDALAAVLVLEPGADHLLLENVAVDPAAQGRGLGSRLLGHVEDEARARSLPEVRLYTHVLMASNIAWYERHGFVRAGEDGVLPRRRVWLRKVLDPRRDT
jgi:N-acetylglutamate synthase-like GNAT family acetyltransferase